MTEVTPQDFDFDAWLDGAERPERSVTVYQKAGLIAELDALAEMIQHAEAAEDLEPALTEVGEARKLRAKYAELAQQFHDSALTIRVGGKSEAEKYKIAADNVGVTQDDLGCIILADAIVSPKITAKQVRRLDKKIGPAQFGKILDAFKSASEDVPSVSADFLPKRSTPDAGGEY